MSNSPTPKPVLAEVDADTAALAEAIHETFRAEGRLDHSENLAFLDLPFDVSRDRVWLAVVFQKSAKLADIKLVKKHKDRIASEIEAAFQVRVDTEVRNRTEQTGKEPDRDAVEKELRPAPKKDKVKA